MSDAKDTRVRHKCHGCVTLPSHCRIYGRLGQRQKWKVRLDSDMFASRRGANGETQYLAQLEATSVAGFKEKKNQLLELCIDELEKVLYKVELDILL